MGPTKDQASGAGENPLLDDSPSAFDDLIEAVGPASLLLVIERRMSASLSSLHSAEDILQEALLHAWRDRKRFAWRGQKSFRSWILSIVDNRIHDAIDRASAEKRGGGQLPAQLSSLEPAGSTDGHALADRGLVASTTPSRIAVYREQASAMKAALESLPDDLREVVRLRLFEKLPLEEIAARIGIGESGVRHRFRRGALLYEEKVASLIASQSGDGATPGAANSSPSR